jgi:hypothetical protein
MRYLIVLFVILAGIGAASLASGDSGRTVGLLRNDEGTFSGYTLFAPMRSGTTYLIDDNGMVVQTWQSDYIPSASVYLKENGNLLRTGRLGGNPTFNIFQGEGGVIQEFSWDGDVVWEYTYSTADVIAHHDIEPLPNGNVLILAWELVDAESAIAAGRDPDRLAGDALWPEQVIEVQPTGPTSGDIVWEWHLTDHLVQDFDNTKDNFGVVADHPELVDVNFGGTGADWNHANSVDYNAELDEILLSARHQNEVWIIDHSTTPEESAGHTGGNSSMGGDLLYRWGNPATYQAGDESDQVLFWQHDARWIEPGLPGAGNIMIFNNGPGRELEFTSVDEIAVPLKKDGTYSLTPGEAYGPSELAWTYQAENPTDFFASFISGAHRLPNGSTLITDGQHGRFFEVTADGETVWEYVNPDTGDALLAQADEIDFENLINIVFRSERFAPDFPAFAGKTLTPLGSIEVAKPTPSPTVTSTPVPTATPIPVPGDADGDGQLTSLDALSVLQLDAGLLSSLPNAAAADVNQDGSTTSIDAALILQVVAGLAAFL